MEACGIIYMLHVNEHLNNLSSTSQLVGRVAG